jgi:sodium-dependent dicarboxylate transporter 2/3/5
MISVLSGGHGRGSTNFARSPYATGLLLMTAYASSVGGIATPIGTATNIVAIGYLKQPEYLGRPIDFLQWAFVGIPMALVIFVGLFCLLRRRSPAGDLQISTLRNYLQAEYARLGPWKTGEINTLIVFLTVVALWVTPGLLTLAGWRELRETFSRHLPEEIAALLAPVLLFLLPVDWKRREFSLEPADLQKIDWGTVLLFGAGLSLGNLMFKTGLAHALGQMTFDAVGTRDVWVITALAIAAGILLSEFTSNAATVVALLPVILTICRQAEVDPLWPSLGVTFGSSFGSALPVSTPPNAIVYGSGLIPVRRMIGAGIGVDVVCGVVIWCVLRIAALLAWTPVAD